MRFYVISGVAGMTGNELVRQILSRSIEDKVLGFDNFYASSLETLADCLDDERFTFLEYDLNNKENMRDVEERVCQAKKRCSGVDLY
ncbi:MAG: NAD-dependent epimerase/dehydratase family protein [Selenomonadaceae bacterium]|nr:NAD-dependent epimerase/dehydratase family protein [Selenomonadaceae bacterium]